uniref:F-box domain-containing protein n=1 Tax=Caenorhabditis tropicalis TaxID=1561998 RepID=A0A1I7TTP3_9PELO
MSLFRLLDLPYVAQKEVIEQLHFMTVLELSFRNRAFYNIARKCKFPVFSFRWVFQSIDLIHIEIEASGECFLIQFTPTPQPNPPDTIFVPMKKRRWAGLRYNYKSFMFLISSELSNKFWKDMSEYLHEILRVKYHYCVATAYTINYLSNCYIGKLTNNYRKVDHLDILFSIETCFSFDYKNAYRKMKFPKILIRKQKYCRNGIVNLVEAWMEGNMNNLMECKIFHSEGQMTTEKIYEEIGNCLRLFQ